MTSVTRLSAYAPGARAVLNSRNARDGTTQTHENPALTVSIFSADAAASRRLKARQAAFPPNRLAPRNATEGVRTPGTVSASRVCATRHSDTHRVSRASTSNQFIGDDFDDQHARTARLDSLAGSHDRNHTGRGLCRLPRLRSGWFRLLCDCGRIVAALALAVPGRSIAACVQHHLSAFQ